VTFKETWSRTRGNTWRIFWGIFACSWPPILVLLMVLFLSFVIFVSAQIADSFPVFNIVIETSYCLLILPIWIGFLSHSYRHFSGRYSEALSTRRRASSATYLTRIGLSFSPLLS